MTESISSSDYGLYLQWYTDTIINTPDQFKLDGIYSQTWIVTKDENDMISIDYNYSFDVDNGYTEISLEEFRGIVFVGGFSYSDVLGAGNGWKLVIENNMILKKQFDDWW